MDTLPTDLLTVISKHYDALQTVFLTDQPLDLVDVCGEEENWPWILENLKNGGYLMMVADSIAKDGDKHGLFEFYMADDLYCKEIVYVTAYKYNNQLLINRLTGRVSLHIHNKIGILTNITLGGHVELFRERYQNKLSLELVSAAFQSGNEDIIGMVGPSEYDGLIGNWIDYAIMGAIKGNQLNLVKRLVKDHNLPSPILDEYALQLSIITSKTYEVLVYLFESKLLEITEPFILAKLLIVISTTCQNRLFKWIIEYFKDMLDKVDKKQIIDALLMRNRLDCAIYLMDKHEIFELYRQPQQRQQLNNFLKERGYRRLYYELNSYLS